MTQKSRNKVFNHNCFVLVPDDVADSFEEFQTSTTTSDYCIDARRSQGSQCIDDKSKAYYRIRECSSLDNNNKVESTARLDWLLMESAMASPETGSESKSKDVVTTNDENLIKTSEGFETTEFEDWASNFCFLAGSILYVFVAVWDVCIDAKGSTESALIHTITTDSSNFLVNHNGSLMGVMIIRKILNSIGHHLIHFKSWFPKSYVMLSCAAALCYIIDASFQMKKSLRHKSKSSGERQESIGKDNTKYHHNPSFSETTAETMESEELDEDLQYFYHNHGHIEVMNTLNEEEESKYCLNGKSALIIGTFGGGALLQFISALLADHIPFSSKILNDVGVHLYLLNAVVLTYPIFLSTPCSIRKCFRLDKYKSCCRAETLDYYGDLLFLIGSIIDLLLSYWDLETQNKKVVDWFHLLSAILWLIDAVFYIAADCIIGIDHNSDNVDTEYQNLSDEVESEYGNDEHRNDNMSPTDIIHDRCHFTNVSNPFVQS